MLEKIGNLISRLEQESVTRDNALIKRLNEYLRQMHANGVVDQVELQRQLHGIEHQHSVAYTNLVMLGGYAGFFAFWQLTRDLVSPATSATVAIMLLTSLILFSGFEVLKMTWRAFSLARLNQILDGMQDQALKLQTYHAVRVEKDRQIHRLWLWFLIPTVLTGFGAGLVMAVVLAQHLTTTLVSYSGP